MSENPDLLSGGQDKRVLPTAHFRNITEDGRVVESVKALPAVKAKEVKFYYSTVPTASFHRTDGKRLGFNFNMFCSDLVYDQQYLDTEIADCNPYVREATEDEIRGFNYRLDPKGQMRKEVLNDPEIKKRLEDEIYAELLRNAAPGSALAAELDRLKIGGAGGGDGSEKGPESIRAGSAVITPAASEPSRLGGIVTSTDIASAAAGGTSGSAASILSGLLAKK